MLLPDPLRNGYYTQHHLRWSLSLGEEAAILATLCDRTTWIHDATNSSAPGWQGCKERGTYIKKTGMTLPKAKKTLRKLARGPVSVFLMA